MRVDIGRAFSVLPKCCDGCSLVAVGELLAKRVFEGKAVRSFGKLRPDAGEGNASVIATGSSRGCRDWGVEAWVVPLFRPGSNAVFGNLIQATHIPLW